jgi:hypothetical protein
MELLKPKKNVKLSKTNGNQQKSRTSSLCQCGVYELLQASTCKNRCNDTTYPTPGGAASVSLRYDAIAVDGASRWGAQTNLRGVATLK